VPVDHADQHPICGDCHDERHPGQPPDVALTNDAVRCEWCANYTRTGIIEVCDPDDVPRHKEDPTWLERAGARVEGVDPLSED
jgi:hypothetical protein